MRGLDEHLRKGGAFECRGKRHYSGYCHHVGDMAATDLLKDFGLALFNAPSFVIYRRVQCFVYTYVVVSLVVP